ncbi:VOC family protein [Mesorhizobium sp. SB112]|uniref:VOC family protein n=1 Tax=Mesorhizobium sp. SB112 TaxID=3151853 RepID=UPI00326787B7
MAVKRIVSNIAVADIEKAKAFYREIFELEIIMDFGWIATFGSGNSALTQMSVMTEGGSGTEVPDLSIEVDDVDALYRRAKAAGAEIAYELADEPWGVRRFYMRDPFGKLLNVLSHFG